MVAKTARSVVRTTERASLIRAVRVAPIAIALKASAAVATVVPPVNSVFGTAMVRILCVATHASQTANAPLGVAAMVLVPNAATTVSAPRASVATALAPSVARRAIAPRVSAATALVPTAVPRRTAQPVSIATMAPVLKGAGRTATARTDCTASMEVASSAVPMWIARTASVAMVPASVAATTTIVPKVRIATAARVSLVADRIATARAGIVALTSAPNVA